MLFLFIFGMLLAITLPHAECQEKPSFKKVDTIRKDCLYDISVLLRCAIPRILKYVFSIFYVQEDQIDRDDPKVKDLLTKNNLTDR